MKDDVEIFRQGRPGVQFPLKKTDAEALEKAAAGGVADERGHGLPPGAQALGEMAPDEARRSGDQDAAHETVILARPAAAVKRMEQKRISGR